MTAETASALLFYGLAILVVGGALVVAFARNIVRCAFALLATFAGVAGLYAFLSADLLAVVQLMVYVGGVLILILFAVMLTSRIDDANISNPAIGRWGGLLVLHLVALPISYAGVTVFADRTERLAAAPTTAAIGDQLLSTYVLPFEVVSIVLLAVLLGAVTIASDRLRKGDRSSAGRSPRVEGEAR